MKYIKLLCLIITLLPSTVLLAQDEIIGDTQGKAIKVSDVNRVEGIIINGDTVPLVRLRTIYIIDHHIFTSSKKESRYNKLVRDVKKVYPYAKLAGEKMREYNIMLQGKSQSEKKKLMKQIEKELKEEFGADLKKLTFTQGRILLKLVDRETGETSYEVIKELRGSFSAFFWQSVSKIFGYNLRSEYDPEEEDKKIEQIILLIELGEL